MYPSTAVWLGNLDEHFKCELKLHFKREMSNNLDILKMHKNAIEENWKFENRREERRKHEVLHCSYCFMGTILKYHGRRRDIRATHHRSGGVWRLTTARDSSSFSCVYLTMYSLHVLWFGECVSDTLPAGKGVWTVRDLITFTSCFIRYHSLLIHLLLLNLRWLKQKEMKFFFPLTKPFKNNIRKFHDYGAIGMMEMDS